MKVALINPSFSYHTPWLQVTEPLGILYIASYLGKYSKHETTVIDCLDNRAIRKVGPSSYWYGLTYDELLDKISIIKPSVVGVTCMFSRKKDNFLDCVQAIKQRFSEIKIVAGGTYPSLFPQEVMSTGFVDYCIIGEGEESFTHLLDAIENNSKSFDHVEGLAYLQDGTYVCNTKKTYINDLDTIPFPARDMVHYESYVTGKCVLHGLGLRRSASILTSRSCPNRCNFCSMFRIHGPKWRGRSAENVVSEIIFLAKEYKVKDFFIMDDNFSINRTRVEDICNGIIASNVNIRWNTPNGVSINTLDHELLKLMKESGCNSICVAIESGDDELRNKVIGKHLQDSKIKEVVRSCANLGVFVTGFFIIGMPGETKEKFARTIDIITTLPFNGVAAAFANPLPGTKLYQDCIDNGYKLLCSDTDGGNVLYRPYIMTSEFTEEELIQREKTFYRTFLKSHFFLILKDAILMKNLLLYPPFLLRILKDRIFRS